ncbi:peptidase inhibitor family I36 protein [Kutzneria kofuensis]|uniref:Peptidase inhibitor family I36 n=1 Tax=Kutzneria kofuensis TaxID=103725 RepID=A0A7W9NLK3_9PSEU|nr:peptidase inhibitor family I36 protein [Kutzneria kofuensis]MBB5896378.1 hypothetical protein [Kutzneria kofuensis]
MSSRPLFSSLAVAAVIGAGISASVAPASATPADATCDSGYCVWSGANYTGTKVVLDIHSVNSCITPSAPGFDATRSAASTGDVYALEFFATPDCTGPEQTVMYRTVPTFDTPMRGIKAFIIRF